MNLLLLLAVAVPLSCCLAFLSLLAFLGVVTIGAVIHVVGIARAGRAGLVSNQRTAPSARGSYQPQLPLPRIDVFALVFEHSLCVIAQNRPSGARSRYQWRWRAEDPVDIAGREPQ
jgi:hypothetical protein